jgi:hypothetical protein
MLNCRIQNPDVGQEAIECSKMEIGSSGLFSSTFSILAVGFHHENIESGRGDAIFG